MEDNDTIEVFQQQSGGGGDGNSVVHGPGSCVLPGQQEYGTNRLGNN